MFVIVDCPIIFHKKCVFMVNLCTKHHFPRSSGAWVIATRPEGKENIYTVTLLLFHILKYKYRNKSCIFFQDLLSFIISGPLK
jgi:hypothetical protein